MATADGHRPPAEQLAELNATNTRLAAELAEAERRGEEARRALRDVADEADDSRMRLSPDWTAKTLYRAAVDYLLSISIRASRVLPAADPRATPEALERELRRLLFTGHGCAGADLYGDDGEMQDKRCGIDFLRATPDQIEQAWRRPVRALLAHPPQEPGLLADLRAKRDHYNTTEGDGIEDLLGALDAFLNAQLHSSVSSGRARTQQKRTSKDGQ